MYFVTLFIFDVDAKAMSDQLKALLEHSRSVNSSVFRSEVRDNLKGKRNNKDVK